MTMMTSAMTSHIANYTEVFSHDMTTVTSAMISHIAYQTLEMFSDDMTSVTSPMISHIANQTDMFDDDMTTSHTTANKSSNNDVNCAIIGANVTVPWDNPYDVISLDTEERIDRIKASILIPVLYLVGLPTNLVNMAVFARQGLGERINLCLFALALVDLTFITFIFAAYIERTYRSERFSPVFTYFTNNNLLGMYGLQYATNLLSAIISTERCMCVLFPLHAKKCVPTKVFAVAMTVSVLLVTFLRFLVTAQYRVACFYEEKTGRLSRRLGVTNYRYQNLEMLKALDGVFYGFCITIGCPVVVFVTTAITGFKLYQTVRWRKTSSSSSSSSTTNSSSSAISSKEIGVTKMLICLSVEFFLLNISTITLRVFSLIQPQLSPAGLYANSFITLISIGELCIYASSSVNFFVYFFAGSRFRDTLKTMLGRNVVAQQQEHPPKERSTDISITVLSRV